jgi:hypothetical protein
MDGAAGWSMSWRWIVIDALKPSDKQKKINLIIKFEENKQEWE